jgi:hypothetical protein
MSVAAVAYIFHQKRTQSSVAPRSTAAVAPVAAQPADAKKPEKPEDTFSFNTPYGKTWRGGR